MGTGTTMGGMRTLNMRSAYMHVLADAATSVLAIVALFGGLLWERLVAGSVVGSNT